MAALDGFAALIYDNVIMRTIVDLPPDQVTALAEFCQSFGISRAEAVRRALAKMLEGRRDAGREKAFGAWKRKKLRSTDYVRRIRDEWGS